MSGDGEDAGNGDEVPKVTKEKPKKAEKKSKKKRGAKAGSDDGANSGDEQEMQESKG